MALIEPFEAVDHSKPLSLYIHVPFCTTKCGYCAFYSLPCKAWDAAVVDDYSEKLLALVKEAASLWGRPFKTIYIGGGNPGLLGPGRLASIIEAASVHGEAEEVSFEINPETLDPSFGILMDGLASRVSVGVQSFNPDHLKTLGRNASRQDAMRAIDLLSTFRARHGIRFNADLMTNIPRQTLEDAMDDVRTLSSWDPDHISLYSLTMEEGTALAAIEEPLGEDEEADHLYSLWSLLDSLGYRRYEVSAFARPGRECVHNQVYWSLGQYLGLGPTAESLLGWKTVTSARQADSLESWLSSPGAFTGTVLTRGEVAEELLLTGLRTTRGLDKEAFQERTGTSFDDLLQKAFGELDPKLYDDGHQFFSLTQDGTMISDRVILSLALALDQLTADFPL